MPKLKWIVPLVLLASAATAAPALAETLGFVPLHVTDTPVSRIDGVLGRNDPIAIHELVVEEAIVMREDVGRRAMGARAGAVLSGIRVGLSEEETGRTIYCDLAQFRAFNAANLFCFEDSDHDGRVDKRWLATAQGQLSFLFAFFAPSDVAPAAYEEVSPENLPRFRLALDSCALGRTPTFRWTVDNGHGWNAGLVSRCPFEGRDGALEADGIRASFASGEEGIGFRVEQSFAPGHRVLLMPTAPYR
jgi:hypothetical protein